MAVNPPVTPPAEEGVATSEWRAMLTAAGSDLAATIGTILLNHAHALTSSDVTAIVSLLGAANVVVVSYVVSRGIRKAGTPG